MGYGLVSLAVVLVVTTMCDATSSKTLVPNIPASVTLETTSLYNLWTHALRQQKDGRGNPLRADGPGPNTILSPEAGKMVNLAPMDGPHPLYADEYTDLRTEFLLDHMIAEAVSPDDARMSRPEGLTVNNLNGKQLTLKKDASGKISVGGITVETFQTLPDGRINYDLSDFLFDHEQRAHEALEHLHESQPVLTPFHAHLELPPF
ncbi:uncharacterized protein LOC121862348 isoform X3 [Homarus americanus]|uniref:uncharacterized protein LOC121862348 isoform X1 n=1 Tax=Homarus americanus TaxID=6706 RepID=UPI001C47D465|nr:uncharacterized protein LOC121862348 isoform X1 [Homarus americanus]XP_042216512.1 uncharacterized protein LOC121862348 isoform X3 [Homarus americanus]